MKPIVPDTTPPPATDIRPLREAEIPAASALVRRVFAEFEAPDYRKASTSFTGSLPRKL